MKIKSKNHVICNFNITESIKEILIQLSRQKPI